MGYFSPNKSVQVNIQLPGKQRKFVPQQLKLTNNEWVFYGGKKKLLFQVLAQNIQGKHFVSLCFVNIYTNNSEWLWNGFSYPWHYAGQELTAHTMKTSDFDMELRARALKAPAPSTSNCVLLCILLIKFIALQSPAWHCK